ncbi:MAG TPA: hypothetical protein DEB10_12920 [Ruminococcaceae bacterium]|nr:hypothetical protein [Oscillospiraceae bacterium]
MKNEKLASKRFWMILTIMLSAFILISATVLVCVNPFTVVSVKTNDAVENDANLSTQDSGQTADSFERRFNATKDRVNEINDNYGRSVKASYSGSDSTVEKMMKQRMIINTIKSFLIIVLIVLVILLILVKGFNLALFKKRVIKAVSEESDATDGKSVDIPAAEEKTQAPDTDETESSPEQTDESSNEPQDEKVPDADEQEAVETTVPKEADEKEVSESCQLP